MKAIVIIFNIFIVLFLLSIIYKCQVLTFFRTLKSNGLIISGHDYIEVQKEEIKLILEQQQSELQESQIDTILKCSWCGKVSIYKKPSRL